MLFLSQNLTNFALKNLKHITWKIVKASARLPERL